jgi:hypothetical protein|tara:strand:+ start:527 stop:889 length:363 start_codon:yes stop_codon:yes gene_type:complete
MADLTGFKKDNKGIFIVKDPDANIQYALDYSEYLNTGDTILDDSTGEPTVTLGTISGDSAPLAFPTSHAQDVSATSTKVTFRVNGGTAGNSYPVEVKIVTSAGDTDSRHFRIICKDKGLE